MALRRRGRDSDRGTEAMTAKLRLGPLPRTELVRLNVSLPAVVKADLDRYAELYGAAYGEAVDPAALVPHMLAAFMERDRAFRKSRQVASPATPVAINTTSSTRAAPPSVDIGQNRTGTTEE